MTQIGLKPDKSINLRIYKFYFQTETYFDYKLSFVKKKYIKCCLLKNMRTKQNFE